MTNSVFEKHSLYYCLKSIELFILLICLRFLLILVQTYKFTSMHINMYKLCVLFILIVLSSKKYAIPRLIFFVLLVSLHNCINFFIHRQQLLFSKKKCSSPFYRNYQTMFKFLCHSTLFLFRLYTLFKLGRNLGLNIS